ncbi:hypothetical protein MNBD_GAMMA25-2368 [hydrothermal vent metagenome]|uniref:HPt domain-containing protein n=1 Tax=hydrothermal vent metagenome TaxID=652676 RepID=A0A3B1BSJ9_9ZZZZ
MADIFDLTTALEQAGGSEALARDLFTMLLNELPTQRESICLAFQRVSTEGCALDTLWDPVHKLHGSTAYLGVPALKQAIKAFEDKIKGDERNQFASYFKILDAEIQNLLEQGETILSQSWT